MKPISFKTLSVWQDQAVQDALSWAKAKTAPISEARLKDFEAGFVAGWRDAIATLKLHGFLKETYADEALTKSWKVVISQQKGSKNAKTKV